MLSKFFVSGDSCPISGQSPIEEFANAIIHGLGFFLSIGGLILLTTLAGIYGTVWHIVGCTVYGVTLVLLFGASTLYHSAHSLRLKPYFQIADHACIFLLIAGTYTPFLFVSLTGGWRWGLFGVEWGLAFIGIVLKLFYVNRFNFFSTMVYLGMGWLIVLAIDPLMESLPPDGLLLLTAGGVIYSLGTIFYLFERIFLFHAIWHLFVLSAAICHYLAVVLYILPIV